MTGRVIVLRGDAASIPLPDASVDLIVTSPPYWALRDYRDDGESLKGQIGDEDSPSEWLAALVACTREWMRVLKPEGSMFVDLGDKYSARADASAGRTGRRDHVKALPPARNTRAFGREKSLLLLPERYRIACMDELGLIARAKVVWHKLTPLPESARDRVQTAHEDMVHLTKAPRYFAAVDEIRVPHTGGTHARRADRSLSPKEASAVHAGHRRGFFPADKENPLGKLPGSVWSIASVPLVVPDAIAHARCCGGVRRVDCEDGVDHHAAFPPELVRRAVLGWSPTGICTTCGQGRQPVTTASREVYHGSGQHRDGAARTGWRQDEKWETSVSIAGYSCDCPSTAAPVRPAVVLDPFGGSGTTALTAAVLGRTGISVDLSHDYGRIARWRTADPAERARALGVAKPPVQVNGQGDLFSELEAS